MLGSTQVTFETLVDDGQSLGHTINPSQCMYCYIIHSDIATNYFLLIRLPKPYLRSNTCPLSVGFINPGYPMDTLPYKKLGPADGVTTTRAFRASLDS